jgi:hypothetical protein
MTNNIFHQQSLEPLSQSSLALLTKAISLLQTYIENLGYKAQIHFELEGCYRVNNVKQPNSKLNFEKINKYLSELSIDGEIVSEYWRNQWEYVSLFNGKHRSKKPQIFIM